MPALPQDARAGVNDLRLRAGQVKRDLVEGFANAAIGLLVSYIAVRALRAVGAWETLPALAVSLVFFGISWGRSFVLRRVFRWKEWRK